MEKIEQYKLLILDVDGTLTDSGVFYTENGDELKKFSTRDYAGVMAAHYIGLKVAIVTGRNSAIVERRAKELKIDLLFQGQKNKKETIKQIANDLNIGLDEMIYIGDDLNDLGSMLMVGFRACPVDACQEIKNISNYVSTVYGGCGVVQDVLRHILEKYGKWDSFIKEIILKGY